MRMPAAFELAQENAACRGVLRCRQRDDRRSVFPPIRPRLQRFRRRLKRRHASGQNAGMRWSTDDRHTFRSARRPRRSLDQPCGRPAQGARRRPAGDARRGAALSDRGRHRRPARTVRFLPPRQDVSPPQGGSVRMRLIDDVKPGDVLVFDAMGSAGGPVFGDMVALVAAPQRRRRRGDRRTDARRGRHRRGRPAGVRRRRLSRRRAPLRRWHGRRTRPSNAAAFLCCRAIGYCRRRGGHGHPEGPDGHCRRPVRRGHARGVVVPRLDRARPYLGRGFPHAGGVAPAL